MQDSPRTFPGHPWLDTPEGHAALRRVLVGYSFRDCYVGYCQVIFESILCAKQVNDLRFVLTLILGLIVLLLFSTFIY